MGKIIDFKVAKQNIENKKKEKLRNNKKIKKNYDYKFIILIFIIILVVTVISFLCIPESKNPERVNFFGNKISQNIQYIFKNSNS